ncbi:unnamed protein product, partial [Brachionus calyciflorus]
MEKSNFFLMATFIFFITFQIQKANS